MYLKRTFHIMQRLSLLSAILFVFSLQLWTTCAIAQTQTFAPMDSVDLQSHHQHTSAASHECCDESAADTSLCEEDCRFLDGLSPRAESVSVPLFILPSDKVTRVLTSSQAFGYQPKSFFAERALRHYVQIFYLVLTI